MADGSLIFDTLVDFDGINKAVDKIRDLLLTELDKVGESTDALKKKVDSVTPSAKALSDAFDYDTAGVKELTDRQGDLERSIDESRAALVGYHRQQLELDRLYQNGEIDGGAFEELREDIDAVEASLAAQQDELLRTTQAIAKVGDAASGTADKTDKFKNASRDAASKSDNLGDKAKKAASGMGEAGNQAQGAAPKIDTMTVAMGNLVARGLEKTLSAMKDFLKMGVSYASGLQEVENVINVTFGPKGAARIKDWSKAASDSFGLSELQAKEFSGTLGSMTKAMGASKQKSLEMSISLSQLAGDMASFKDIGIDEAFNKIRSAIAGEYEPLKSIGYVLDEASVKAYAFSKGIARSGKELTNQQKVLARYGMIMQLTKDAHGNFNREVDSFSNQLRLASNNMRSAAGIMGKELLPVLTEGLTKFNDFINENGDTLSQWGGVIASVADILLDILEIVVQIPPEIVIFALAGAALLTAIMKIVEATAFLRVATGGLSTAAGLASVSFSHFGMIIIAVVAGVSLLLFLFLALSEGIGQAESSLDRYGRKAKEISSNASRSTTILGNGGRGYAIGTLSAPRGAAWVGEKGPELVEFSGGERVYTATQSAALAASQGGGQAIQVINYNRIDASNLAQVNRLIEIFNGERMSMRMGYSGR